jgi:S1-C subfamily serine protease
MTVRLYRLLAALCDLLIATVFFLLWGWLRRPAGGVGWWLLGIVLFVVVWMEVCWRLGGSPGKAMFNLGASFRSRGNVYLRELVGKTATWCTGGLGLLPIFTSQQRALHDYIAGTDVSHVQNGSGVVDVLRIGFAAVAGGLVVLAYVGEKNSPGDATSTAVPAKWNVSDSSKAVMTIHVYRGKDEYAQGSGFLIDSQGTAVSNVHVIGAGDRAEVELDDGRKFAVTDVRAYDMTQDVAIFRIGNETIGNARPGAVPAVSFPTVQLGTSDKLQLLDKVVVISSPEGLSNTVTEGVLSQKRGGEQPALQVSAAISPGSSGGPVFDEAGRVVGVAQSQWEEGENLNFAIPVEVVNMLLKKPDMNVTTQKFFTSVLHRNVNSDKDYDDDDSGDNTKTIKP